MKILTKTLERSIKTGKLGAKLALQELSSRIRGESTDERRTEQAKILVQEFSALGGAAFTTTIGPCTCPKAHPRVGPLLCLR